MPQDVNPSSIEKAIDALPSKQRRFVKAFNGNIRETAAAAGITYQWARRLMMRAHIKEIIQQRDLEMDDPLIANREERQRYWTKIMRGEMDREEVRIIERKDKPPVRLIVHHKPDYKEELRASELLGKSQGDFIEKVQQVGGDAEISIFEILEEIEEISE